MRSQARNRRSRNHKEVDDTQLNIPRDESQLPSYSRHQHSSHYNDAHRVAASMPSRPAYDVGRDRTVVPARNVREEDWSAGASHDRYGYDLYHHGEHDGYDNSMRRDNDAWGASNEGRYSSRAGWSQSYHHSEASTSYQEPPSWNPSSPVPIHYNSGSQHYKSAEDPYIAPRSFIPRTPNPYEGRSPLAFDDSQGYYYEGWRGREPRPATPPEEHLDYHPIDKRGNQSWKKDGRKSGGQKFQSDAGWSGRRKGKDWGDQRESRWDEKPTESSVHTIEERSWEPAESWKSSNRHDDSSTKPQTSRNSGQQKSTRRGKNGGKSRRDWKGDDINLNNWTRRDGSTSKKSQEKQPSGSSRRKHQRSNSRSHSRDSARSRHSSYRSRSSSPVAKRRRRGSSPLLRSRSPAERDRTGWQPPLEDDRMVSPTPSPYKNLPVYRRCSPSTASDRSTNRSRSPSPYERRRPVHRLPTAVPAVQSSPAVSTSGRSKKSAKQRNGQTRGRPSGGKQQARQPEDDIKADSVSMPPPPPPIPLRLNRASRQSTPDRRDEMPSNGLPPKPLSLPEKPTRIVPTKQALFKPIGQPNSALKMFFPGDEDDADLASGSDRHKGGRNESLNSGKTFTRPTQTNDVHNGRIVADAHFHPAETESHPIPPAESWDHYHAPAPEPTTVAQAYATRNERYRNGVSKTPEVSPSWNPEPLDWGGSRAAGTDRLPHEPLPYVPPIFPPSREPEPQFVRERELVPSHTGRSTPQPSPISISKPSPAWPSTSAVSATSTTAGQNERDSKDLYVILNQVGEGTFGKVYKARNTAANIYVALKRIRMETERDGFPVTAMREIKLLQSLKHSNVVRLYEMMVSNGSVFMVFEYMDHDLTGILSQTQFKFSDAHLKSLCHQMLAGVAYLHHKGVIHRDIKGSNILLNNRGELKLADFGLARFYQKRRRTDYTNRVITLWYRPPELLFGSTVYGAEVDMWSAGCIMLELFTKKPVFQGNDEIHQLHVVFKILGTPTAERWPGLLNLPWFELIKPKEALPNRFRELFQRWMSPAALDLAERLLTYDPELRVTAQDAMEAPYFTQEQPFAERPTGLSTLDGEWHELETKQERLKKRKKPESVA